MAYSVQTDHQIFAFSPDLMGIFDAHTGTLLANATRTCGNTWLIHTDTAGVDDVTALGRDAAVTALRDHPLLFPGAAAGYSCSVPPGCREPP